MQQNIRVSEPHPAATVSSTPADSIPKLIVTKASATTTSPALQVTKPTPQLKIVETKLQTAKILVTKGIKDYSFTIAQTY